MAAMTLFHAEKCCHLNLDVSGWWLHYFWYRFFLQRVSTASAQSAELAMIDSVCPSVRLSVTVRYHVKMTQATIMWSSLKDRAHDSHFLRITAKFHSGRRMREG